MAIAPNDTFTSGQILTAAECNAFPFGVCALATSTTNYTLTTSAAIATGMTVTFTAVANRYYKITYYEPQIATSTVAGSFTATQIKLTNAAGTQYQQGIVQTAAALSINSTIANTFVGTFTAGSTVIVGCAVASNITGAPVASRSATSPAFLLVEDIGPA
jgi:hypothetical protein